MNQHDLAALRRRLNPEERYPSVIRGCYVAADGQVFASFTKQTGMMPSDEYEKYFLLKRGEAENDFFCILNSAVQGQRCVVLAKSDEVTNKIMDETIHNLISLFIEKNILRDQIVYESEHDKLTGLYNKGKYMSMKKETFGSPKTITVYNFDVNNLKYINDHYGHESGDALIINAAKSIAAVCGENVFGFRMGGDEYLMVAADLTKEQADAVFEKWQNALDRINENSNDVVVSMACGMVYAEGEYDYDLIYSQSDKLMYAEKKRLKGLGRSSFVIPKNQSE